MADEQSRGDPATGDGARRGPMAKLTSTYRWHPGATGIPYWQMLLARAVVVLIALSFVAYLVGSPSWGEALVLGIAIGAVVVPSLSGQATSETRPALPAERRPVVTATTLASAADDTDIDHLDFATDAKFVLGPAYAARRDSARDPAAVAAGEPSTPDPPERTSLLARLTAEILAGAGTPPAPRWSCPAHHRAIARTSPEGREYLGCPECDMFERPGGDGVTLCAAHSQCGPVGRIGHSAHGHGPSEATGLWCWHLDEWYLGRPDEEAPEGSDLEARRAQQAGLNGGDPLTHKTYPTAQ